MRQTQSFCAVSNRPCWSRSGRWWWRNYEWVLMNGYANEDWFLLANFYFAWTLMDSNVEDSIWIKSEANCIPRLDVNSENSQTRRNKYLKFNLNLFRIPNIIALRSDGTCHDFHIYIFLLNRNWREWRPYKNSL